MFAWFGREVKPDPAWIIPGILTFHDCMEGIIVTGGTGSGKTSGPMFHIITELLLIGDDHDEALRVPRALGEDGGDGHLEAALPADEPGFRLEDLRW